MACARRSSTCAVNSSHRDRALCIDPLGDETLDSEALLRGALTGSAERARLVRLDKQVLHGAHEPFDACVDDPLSPL